ncbi:MAG TPA: ABC transporter permease [Gaiellaceae bacterium]|jgi:peptide/nickel transport system permease protein|nr:ABC transporter permease [Gaiellaceae bacterium]
MTNPPDFEVTSGGAIALPPVTAIARKSPSRLFWERFRQDKAALVGGVVIFLLLLIAIFGGPLAEKITGHPQNQTYSNMTDAYGVPLGPNSSFWFGADSSGRDLFVLTMYGARTSLFVGVVASGIALLIGLVVGLLAGFFGGWADTLLSRIGDVLLAVPQILIAVGVVAACSTTKSGCLGGLLQPGITVVIAVITLFSWSYIARIVRGYTLSLREKEFVESARAAGASNPRILATEILPNLLGPLIVYATLLIPTNILFEASLSYLGLGVPATQASWGSILSQVSSSGLYNVAWWLMLFPGAMLIITTLAFNLLGDGLRDAFDVRSER